MPRLEEIERLKTILNDLAGEPEVLAERGESIEDVLPSGQARATAPGPAPGVAGAGPKGRAQPTAAAAGAALPEVAPEEGFDASALVSSDDELEALDSFEDFLFGGAAEAAEAKEAPAGGAAPGGREAAGEEPGWEALTGGTGADETPVGEVPGGEGQDEETAEAEPSPPEVDEDLLASLGLTAESFAEEQPEGESPPETGPPPEPWAEAPPTGEPSPESSDLELPEGGEGADEFGIPPGLLGPAEPEEFGEPGEPEGPVSEIGPGAEAVPWEEVEPEAEARGDEEPDAFELPEGFELPEIEGDEEPAGELPAGELPAGELPAGELPAGELPGDEDWLAGLGIDEADEEQGGESVPEAQADEAAFGEEPFELPEEFRMPEEPAAAASEEEAAAVFDGQAEALGEPGEEEAEFLRALQDEILPAAPAGELPAGEVPAGEGVFQEGAAGEAAPAEGPPSDEQWGEVPGVGEDVDLEGSGAEYEVPTPSYDEFSLEGLGEEFGLAEEPLAAGAEGEAEPAAGLAGGPEEIPLEMPGEIAAARGAAVPAAEAPLVYREAPAAAAGELSLSERQFAGLRRTLSQLPRNLKILVEELIGERDLAGEDLRLLVGLLVNGAAPAAVAAEVSRITGTRVRIPKSFEKLTGLEFEAERGSFAYAFRENILPLLRVVALSLAVFALLGFLGYRYVYRPVQAQVLYRQGYNQIERQRFSLANERFDQAGRYWVFKGWFYRYAEAFADQRQYTLAGDKYEQLLRRFAGDRRGTLDYARLLTYNLAGYERAEELVSGLLEANIKDYEALLTRGDNYLEWASEAPPAEAPALYEQARFQYASIIDYYGERDEVLLRMMRYFIRTDKLQQTEDLKAFLDRARMRRVTPELLASVYAELAGYWMDKGRYDGITNVLFKALEARRDLPEVHYHLARFYGHVRDADREVPALREALRLLEGTQPLTKRRLFMLIDTYRRYGESFWRRREYLEAEKNFLQAIKRIEEAQGQRIFGPQEAFGQVYERQGDVHYYVGRDLNAARQHYEKAEQNGHRPPRVDYKIGYVDYSQGSFEEALLRLSKVIGEVPLNENALFALGNALYLGGFYSSAQGYFLRLLDLLETREERIPLLLIHENPEHRALAESLMTSYNNLGVTLYRLSTRSRDPEKESAALVNLTFSSEYFDRLSRDPETAARGITRNLAYLNQRGILYPQSDFDPQLYIRIPMDLGAPGF